jgi:hypothetical protein
VLSAAATTAPNPTTRILTNQPDHRVVDVTGATVPYWLVLGEGLNAGWHASLNGHDLGVPRMVDGGANGWLVTPPANGAVQRISLTWTPQRTVNVGLILSAVGVAVCLVLVVVGGRRERRLGAEVPEPDVHNPLAPTRGVLSWRAATVVTAVTLVGTALVLEPVWSLPLAAAALLSARWPRGRAVLTVGAIGGVVAVGVGYVARQILSHPEPGFGWVTRFEFAHRLALAAVLLVVVDVVVERLRPTSGPRLP